MSELNVKETIHNAAEIRIGIRATYKKYRNLQKVFNIIFTDEVSVLKSLIDGIYYLGGGYPAENSPGRFEFAIEKAAKYARYYSFIGKQDLIISEFKKYGITISIDNELQDTLLSTNELQLIKEVLPNEQLMSRRDLLNRLIEIGCDYQRSICKNADIIKLDLKPRVLESSGMHVHEFSKALELEIDSVNTKSSKFTKKKQTFMKSILNFQQLVK
jgi:hypothetical protein